MKFRAIALIILLALVSIIIPFVVVNYSSSISATQDYQLWVQPYLSDIEKVRAVLMTPYVIGSWGYDHATGTVCGGSVESSPAIGVKAGYQNICVLTDNNIEGSLSLDYFNSANSPLVGQPGFSVIPTQIYNITRAYLSEPFYAIGGCAIPFQVVSYPSSFQLLDRREAEYGSIDPYASIIDKPGQHLGGIGTSCGTQGQVWYLTTNDVITKSVSDPLIVAEMPGSSIGINSNLEELSFLIDEYYSQCLVGSSPCSLWQTAYLNAMKQYPFQDPRQALHFIQASRATAAWTLTNMTVNGLSSFTMLQDTINSVWASAGSNGGLYQNFNKQGSDQTPETNFQAMIAFDPRMPSWFSPPNHVTTSSTSSTTHTTITTSISTTTKTSSSTTSKTTSSSTTTSKSTSSSTLSSSITSSSTSSSTSSQTVISTLTTTTISTTIIFGRVYRIPLAR